MTQQFNTYAIYREVMLYYKFMIFNAIFAILTKSQYFISIDAVYRNLLSFCRISLLESENQCITRLPNVGILGKEREPRVGKLGLHGNFDTGFERNIVQNPVCGFFELY